MSHIRALRAGGAKPLLMPAKPGTCVHCATEHGEHQPHNYWSVYYQVRFVAKFRRDATHADCCAHLPEASRKLYRELVEAHGKKWSEPAEGQPIREPYAESEG